MQLKKLFTLSAAALLAAAPAKITAQTWQTVLDYQFTAGKYSVGEGIAVDGLGNVFSGGTGTDASGAAHGLVLKTDTTQVNWFLSDDSNPSPTQDKSYMYGVGVDASANVYSVGALAPNSTGIPSWYVRKSLDSGLTWSTVDLYQYAAGKMAYAQDFTADNSGNIYAVGWGYDAGTKKTPSNIHWLVRKSADGGKTWALVDDVPGQQACHAGFIPGVGVFVVGDANSAHPSWMVRRSLDAGATWSTVDGPFAQSGASGVCGDSKGNIYVAGEQYIITQPATKVTAAQGYYAWVTRKSSNGGATWSTVDTFAYAPNKSAGAKGSGTDSAGNVVVVGYAIDAQNRQHWIVRRLGLSGWLTVDDFQLAGYGGNATATATDAAGNLLVTGFGIAPDSNGTLQYDWIARKLAP